MYAKDAMAIVNTTNRTDPIVAEIAFLRFGLFLISLVKENNFSAIEKLRQRNYL